jgi:CubicO group peptidase (beta-lactamase class C family)
MRAGAIRFVAVLSALVLFPFTAERALAGEHGSDCGSPSDIHDGWVIGSPEQQGFDPALLCAMGKGVAGGRLPSADSIVVVRHGVLVYERYFHLPGPTSSFEPAAIRHAGHSMTKSVVSLLVGIAVDRGQITDLDASIFSYFPEYADLRSPEKDRITLRSLLTMSDGLDSSDFFQVGGHSFDRDPYRYILATRLAREPGVAFEYNNATTELIGAILQKATGKTVDVLAREDIFTPLGIESVDWKPRLGNGYPMANSGLGLRPRDWAKIGQVVLNGGVWQGKQIVSTSWIRQSTRAHISAPDQYTYGFHWWLGHSLSNDRVIAWTAALGSRAQKTIIVPELDLVVVFNASIRSANMIAPEIELLNQYILPAILQR